MPENKTIKINPDFFKLNNNNNKQKKTQKERKTKPNIEFSNLLKPNNVKKDLLRKIKEKQKIENEKQRENTEINEKDKKQVNVVDSDEPKFENEFQKSLSYLESVVKKKLRDKQKKKSLKKNRIISENKKDVVNNLKNDNIETTSANLNLNKKELVLNFSDFDNLLNTDISNDIKHDKTGSNHISSFYKNNSERNNEKERSDENIITRENSKKQEVIEKPYGCLKGGTKPTYSQYNKTLKKKNPEQNNIVNIINNEFELETKNNIETTDELKQNDTKNLTRKDRLQKIKDKFKIPENKKKKNIIKKYRKFKVRTITRTFKLGKNKNNNSVSVLIKNNKTRKLIQHDINLLNRTPIYEIKKFLKEKNLLKTGSSAPEHILREIYKNVMLSGDIKNINNSNMIHNYLNNEN